MAPEVFNKSPGQTSFDNAKVDVFSAGVVAIWIHSGANPFLVENTGDEDMETYELLRQGDFDAFWEKAAEVPHKPKPDFHADFKRLVWDMLKFDPKERIRSGQAFQRTMDWGWKIQEDSKVTNKDKYMKKRYDKFLREKKQEETLEMQMMKQRQY